VDIVMGDLREVAGGIRLRSVLLVREHGRIPSMETPTFGRKQLVVDRFPGERMPEFVSRDRVIHSDDELA